MAKEKDGARHPGAVDLGVMVRRPVAGPGTILTISPAADLRVGHVLHTLVDALQKQF